MRLVIVDRDGVINEDSADYIRSVDEMRFIDGSLEGLGLLTQAGFSVAVATGIARGYFDVDTLNRMHGALCARAAAVGARIDAVAFCPHGPADRCACRKPSPGLLITLARRFSVGIETTPFIGDSLRDLEAGRAAGHPDSRTDWKRGCDCAESCSHLQGFEGGGGSDYLSAIV